MVSGTFDEVLDAVELILTKLMSEFYAEDAEEAEPISKVRLIAPNGSCGGIIGKGGSMINYIGLNDRLVTVVGTLQQQMQATSLILSRLSEDLHYIQSIGQPFQYAGRHE